MPASLTGRILTAFGLLAVVVWLAIGATMFVVLRGLHADATSSYLADIAQTLAVRIRGATADGEIRRVINQIRSEVVGSDVTIHLLASDGRVVDVGLPDPAPSVAITIPDTTKIGDTLTGVAPFADGQTHDYAALVLRAPKAVGPRAVLLSQVDRSGGAALRDVGRSLPIVILITILVGAPLAILLSRSVARPLARLATRTEDLVDPAAGATAPLPLEGPREVRDLTDRVNAVAIELTRSRAREGELLADLRHDLRTPLTVIGGYASALIDGTATGEAASRAAEAIAEETARLERLVGQLGAIDRLRTGAETLHLEPLDAGQVLAATVARFEAAATAAGVHLAVAGADAAAGAEASPGATLAFAGDRVAVDRILGNLLENALALARPGGTIRLEARRVDDAANVPGPAIALAVVDDGPGFPPGGTDRAFERFYRGDPSRAGAGSGLGLSMVRELARAHGGAAIAENLVPRGARVSVVLPVQAPA